MKGIITYKNKYLVWISLFILLELLPASSKFLERQKRQTELPKEDYDDSSSSSAILCITPNKRQGICTGLASCPILMQITNYHRLRKFYCGFIDSKDPLVCCPDPSLSEPQDFKIIKNNDNTPCFLREECGISKYPKNRVVNGKEANKGSWPWMAVVYIRRKGAWISDCGGSLVTTQHVITAAHCVINDQREVIQNNFIKVRLGEHDLFSNDDGMKPIEVNVLTVTVHENYNPFNHQNDIAVLKLTEPVKFNDNIRPICLPYNALNNEDLTDRKAFVAGWGATKYNGSSSPVLREAMFEIQDQELCKEAFQDEWSITDVHICAGKLDGTKDSCHGDSGGPLMSIAKINDENHFYLVGIVSFGKYCATPGYPGVYTRVTKYLDWLRPLLSS